MENLNLDLDPLASTENAIYPQYENVMQTIQETLFRNQFFSKPTEGDQSHENLEQADVTNQQDILKTDVPQNIKELIPQFPFYGCSICNVSYLTLTDLDHHMAIHKDRITSWDLRRRAKDRKRTKFDTTIVKTENEDDEKKIGNQNDEKKTENENDEKKTENENDEKKTENENDEKIFKCGVCYKQFSLSYYLKLHVRSHTGEKPYQCCECGVSFITASKLGRHRKLHATVKAECRICHKTFSRFEYLTKHFDKNHMDEKLDGEPYDYNAILPYLKELEEELEKQKSEEKPAPDSDWLKRTVKSEDLEVHVKVEPEVIKTEPDIDHMDMAMDAIKDEDSSSSSSNYFPEDIVPETSMEAEEVEEKPKRKAKRKRSPISDDADTKDDLKDDLNFTVVGDCLKCKICEKIIKTPSYMRIHMRTHTGEKPYKCYVCKKGFITSSKMHRHVLTHMEAWESGDAEEITVKVEVDWVNGNRNENDPNAEPKTDKEAVTAKKGVRKKRFLQKKRSKVAVEKCHTAEPPVKKRRKRPHSCEFCQKRFLHLETLHVHRRVHIGEKKIFVCHFCLAKYEDEDGLKVHLVTHTGPKPYTCTICGKKYKRKDTMVYHRRMHKMEKKFECNVCKKTFMAPCKLQRHLLSHRPDKFVVRYECPVCAHIFNTKYHIEMHLTTHEKEGVIQESNRGEILAMVLQNARKIQLPSKNDTPVPNFKDIMPDDERSRVCNICGEVFHHFFYLEEHLKTHGSKIDFSKSQIDEKEERRYKCPVCQKGFKLHYYLKLHSFTHTKEKPFICQQCGKGFITKGKLKRHLESHSGLKKYQCHICLKFFTRPSYLRIHVRTIHGRHDNNDYMHDISIPLASTCLSVFSQD